MRVRFEGKPSFSSKDESVKKTFEIKWFFQLTGSSRNV